MPAGTLNVPKIKGIHQALRCAMAAADYFAENDTSIGFDAVWRKTEAVAELREVRNIKPGFKRGLQRRRAQRRHRKHPRRQDALDAAQHGNLSAREARRVRVAATATGCNRDLPPRDRLSSVFFAVTAHDEVQPAHLKVRDTNICATTLRHRIRQSLHAFLPRAASTRWSTTTPAARRLQINAANCVHCKACDIKDPYQIIDWATPEGGSGPNYQLL